MEEQFDLDAAYQFDAYKRIPYRQFLFVREGQEKTWLSMSESFYRAGKVLIEGVLSNSMMEDVEGRAALFLFRHYLELTLKKIVVAGRYLTKDGQLTEEEVKPITKGHDLCELWQWTLDDAKPKMPQGSSWDSFDWEFAEKCIAEFAAADPKGFSFRYHGQGGEGAHISFAGLLFVMDHAHSVLEAMLTVLIETRGEIVDWFNEQASW